MSFLLTSKALKQFKQAGLRDDFEIKIFDDSVYCNIFTAIFISKQISRNYRNDPTIRHFNIQFPNTSIFYSSIDELKSMIRKTDFIPQFRQLLKGKPIYFETKDENQDEEDEEEEDQNDLIDSKDKAKIFIEVGHILENEEMVEKGLEIIGIDFNKFDMTVDEALELIKINRKLFYPKIIKRPYEIISSNFYSIFTNEKQEKNENVILQLKEMHKEELEMIFSSQRLLVDNEDSLFDIIAKLGPDYYFLYDYIEVEYLSVEKVEQLIENISNNEISLHSLLWSSICRRLIIDISKNKKNFYNKHRHKNPINKSNEIINCETGIIKYLQNSTSKENDDENNNNIYTKKIIDVEVSAVESGKIKNIFDQSKNTLLRVKDQENSFIVVDFKDKKVNLSKYYFSVPDVKGIIRNQPKSWEIQGSNDKKEWDKIDVRHDESSFSYYGASKTFACQNISDKFYRFIRIKEIIGRNNGHELLLAEIEFYGFIQPNDTSM